MITRLVDRVARLVRTASLIAVIGATLMLFTAGATKRPIHPGPVVLFVVGAAGLALTLRRAFARRGR
jgi:hypothetical protein